MSDTLARLLPELVLFGATCVVMLLGLSRVVRVRQLVVPICGVALLLAGGFAINTAPDPTALFPELARFAKVMIAAVGFLLLLLLQGVVDREMEARVKAGTGEFAPLRANRAEFFSFFLFSLTGLMLCASSNDLIWLFLALELTSLPTYIMVAVSSKDHRAQEAAVKYFFLGALGAAVFLYGFALLYGATGTTSLTGIAASFAQAGEINAIGLAGLLIALLGVAFKIAAVPMHFYTPDVYQGAASSVSAMLAFVPKTAGVIAMIALAGVAGWRFGESGEQLPLAIHVMLWVVAALTMTVGNVLATLQDSVKRMLAYSSVAHSGYMLVGILAGPGDTFATSGLAAAMFYLLCYGVMNTGVFGAISAIETKTGEEIDSFDSLRGLCKTNPVMGWTIIVCTLSLLGFPPLLGFIGKFGLFTAGISGGLLPLVIILGLNSAIAAFYYLRLVTTVYLDPKDADTPEVVAAPFRLRATGTVIAGVCVIALLGFGRQLMDASRIAVQERSIESIVAQERDDDRVAAVEPARP